MIVQARPVRIVAPALMESMNTPARVHLATPVPTVRQVGRIPISAALLVLLLTHQCRKFNMIVIYLINILWPLVSYD